jgi:hypothetical protein
LERVNCGTCSMRMARCSPEQPARIGPTTPKPIDPRLLRPIRRRSDRSALVEAPGRERPYDKAHQRRPRREQSCREESRSRPPSAAAPGAAWPLDSHRVATPAALDNPKTHAPPQAVNRTGTTPCCRARSRLPISRPARPLLASRGEERHRQPGREAVRP